MSANNNIISINTISRHNNKRKAKKNLASSLQIVTKRIHSLIKFLVAVHVYKAKVHGYSETVQYIGIMRALMLVRLRNRYVPIPKWDVQSYEMRRICVTSRVAAPVQLRRQHGRSGLIRQMWNERGVWLTPFGWNFDDSAVSLLNWNC